MQKKKELNSLIEISSNEKGSFCSVKTKLELIIKNLLDHNQLSLPNSKIMIKLSGDGTIIYRGNKTLVISFSILNEGKKATTATGTYVIGNFEMKKECYEEIKTSVKELNEELKNLDTINVDNKEYKVEQYLGCDWKFLQICAGIKCANSKFPCIWCKYRAHSTTKHNFKTEKWEIKSHESSRTLEEAKEIIHGGTDEFGHILEPIFDHIPFYRYIIDTLHLFLRVTDKLSSLLFGDLIEQDGSDSNYLQEQYIKFLSDTCRISNPTFLDKTGKIQLRDLVGEEMRRVYKNFEKLLTIFGSHHKIDIIVKIWQDFFEIYENVKQNNLTSNNLQIKTLTWLETFLSKYSHVHITPYMHAFVYHLHQFVKLYDNINAFNLQGMEKKNDILTCQYYRGTNRHLKNNKQHTNDYLNQLLIKSNRLDLLSHIDAD